MKHIRKLTINRNLLIPLYKPSDFITREYKGFIDSLAKDSITEAQKAKKKRREEFIKKDGSSLI